MRWHHRLYVALRGLFGSSALDRELNEELQFHFDRQLQANLDAGMTPQQARRAASLTSVIPSRFAKRRAMTARARWLRQFGRDLSHGVRLLRKAPGFSLGRGRDRRARRRRSHRDFQRRLRHPVAAAALSRSRSPGAI